MKHITVDEVKQMTDTDGLILQGCGGDPIEWLNGINETFTETGILKDGGVFENISIFEHNGITNILFPFDDVNPNSLDIDKLAMWRLQTHEQFGGTWLSDYLPNQLGQVIDEPVADGDSDFSRSNDGDAANEKLTSTEKASTVQVYIANIHDYSIGGFTIPLPTTLEDLQLFMGGAEINGWQDMRIGDFISNIRGLEDVVYEHTSRVMTPELLDELNYLAAKINTISDDEDLVNCFEAAIVSKQHCGSIAELINLADNIQFYELLPAYRAEDYGEIRAEMDGDMIHETIDMLCNLDNEAHKDLLIYIERLEKCIDYKAYGRAVAKEEDGKFTPYGYLTWQGNEFIMPYRGPQDIPDELRIFSKPDQIIQPMLKMENANIAEILAKLYAVCGDNTQSVADTLQPLILGQQKNYLLTVSPDGVRICEATELYKRGSQAFNILSDQTKADQSNSSQVSDSQNRIFALVVNTQFKNTDSPPQDKDRLFIMGDITEINAKALSGNITRHAAAPDRISATYIDGSQKSYDLFTWSQISQQERETIKETTLGYQDTDVQTAVRQFTSFISENEKACKAIDEYGLITAINTPFMNEAQNPQYDRLRISNTVAREILARGDADVYKLTSQGAEQLSSIEATKPMSFAENKPS